MKKEEFQGPGRGSKLEARYSLSYHSKECAFLVSPLVLRSQGLGQIDVAYLSKKNGKARVYLIEVKSSLFPSSMQYRRLLRTQDYLSKVLDLESILEVKFCQKDHQTLFF